MNTFLARYVPKPENCTIHMFPVEINIAGYCFRVTTIEARQLSYELSRATAEADANLREEAK